MKQYLISSLMLLFSGSVLAQTGSIAELGCKTVTTPQEMERLAAYNAMNLAAKTTLTADTIPLSIHIVGESDGKGYYSLDNLFPLICNLNERYIPVGFYFYIAGDIEYINNSNYYNHNFWQGFSMMNQHNVPNTVNVYFVGDPDGACGYFSPGADGVAVKNNCASPNSTTLIHELGHFFNLPHTFSGWENGNTPWNPERVTRGIGANCASTGDLFCDTDADYLDYRWNCPYVGNKVDDLGHVYHPDSSLYMSYSFDGCQSRFSNQQINAMRSNLQFDRSNLLLTPHAPYSALDTPNVIFPTTHVYVNNKTLRWNKVPGATLYQVKVTFYPASIVKQNATVADTTLELDFILSEQPTYQVSITPISGMNTCGKISATRQFKYSNTVTAVGELADDVEAFTVAPNPASGEATVYLSAIKEEAELELTTLTGQRIFHTQLRNSHSPATVSLPLHQVAPGMYLLRLSGKNLNRTEKLVVQ